MTVLYGVYGTGGSGRETMPLLKAQLAGAGTCVFIDDTAQVASLQGVRVLSWDDFLKEKAESRAVSLAIGSGEVRERLHHRAVAAGVGFVQVRANNAMIMQDVEIGTGALIAPFVSMTVNIRVGVQFHADVHSSIAHDCRIGDFVTFGPGARCNGNVVIEDHAYIGSGAVIRQGRPDAPLVIGRGAVVGMGAVVTKDVPAGMTVVGNPARMMRKG